MKSKTLYKVIDTLWDLFCLSSIVGIWPRFIEPRCLHTTKFNWKLPNLHPDLKGLKVLQFTDLHFSKSMSQSFLEKITRKVEKLKPDIIVFTGDFICYSRLEDGGRMLDFLNSLYAPLGCYCILGNHDYSQYVTLGKDGVYNISEDTGSPLILKALRKLFHKKKIQKKLGAKVQDVKEHPELIDFLKKTPFTLLENKTAKIPVGEALLNLVGLGDYWAGRCAPEQAYKSYDAKYPGLVLLHNPDAIRFLDGYPGEMTLCGHTHGGWVNLPIINKLFFTMENPNYKKGLFHVEGRKMYINRGIGNPQPFRWFAPPELLLLTLSGEE